MGRQHRDRRHDQGKAFAEIVAVAVVEPHALGVAQRDDAEAIVLDLVQPVGAARRAFTAARTAICTAADIECDLPVPRPPRKSQLQPRSGGGSCVWRARNTQSSEASSPSLFMNSSVFACGNDRTDACP